MSAVMKHDYNFGKILNSIRGLVREGLELNQNDCLRISMSTPNFGEDEIVEAIDSLIRQNVTMGSKVAAFEKQFAEYIGSKHAIMVNSGSTANLLMMAAITNPDYSSQVMPGDEVIVPALTWGTTLWPIIQMGCIPVLVDSDLDTLNIDVDEVRKAITPKTKAIFAVHILGNAAKIDELSALADEFGLILLEDTCESLGTSYKGRKVGTIGEMGSFSFFFSHHITTIEGGMVVTDNDDLAELLKALRAHGWTRHLEDRSIEADYPEIDPRFMFCNVGYSVRPTEIQGAFGIHQLRKLDAYNARRREVAGLLRQTLAHLPIRFTRPTEGADHTWFGFPVLLEKGSRKDLCDYLSDHNIDTRPIIAGNLAKHPALGKFEHRIQGELPNAQRVMENGFYIGSHPDMTQNQVIRISRVMSEYFT